MSDDKLRPASGASPEAEAEPGSAAANGSTAESEIETPATTPEPAAESVENPPEAGAAAVPESSGERNAGAAAEGVPVSEPVIDAAAGDQRGDTFIWHPDHRGKTFDELRAGLALEIASDQRQHRLAMDGAEESEQDALASVVSLERKWGPYDFDWAEQDPEMLADRIAEFERERERRREMVSWSDYRNSQLDGDDVHEASDRPAELSTATKGMALLLIVLLIIVILLAVWAL